MKKIIIDNLIFELYPNLNIATLVVKNLNANNKDKNYFLNLLDDALKYVPKHLPEEQLSENKVIKKWREAYKKFPNEKGNKSSVENLLKRAKNQNKLPSISPLVDVYNYISVKYGVPCGGEDLETIEGDIHFTFAKGNENFVTYGSNVNEPPKAGEVVYKDNAGIICRSFNWRESVRTMLRENSKNIVFFIEEVDENYDDVNLAIKELQNLIQEIFNTESSIYILNKEHNIIEI
ncbi:B3/4 domain-containing protein [Mycoplasmopsis meleagridis]|uniref:B3/B4 domain-containing protein n=1 Tax=Mycoplasmopsis meleagridis TaxID=29561 RepID=UPI003A8641A0